MQLTVGIMAFPEFNVNTAGLATDPWRSAFPKGGVPMWPALLLLSVAADPLPAPLGQIAFMREGKVKN
jgi:hypothetical protein